MIPPRLLNVEESPNDFPLCLIDTLLKILCISNPSPALSEPSARNIKENPKTFLMLIPTRMMSVSSLPVP